MVNTTCQPLAYFETVSLYGFFISPCFRAIPYGLFDFGFYFAIHFAFSSVHIGKLMDRQPRHKPLENQLLVSGSHSSIPLNSSISPPQYGQNLKLFSFSVPSFKTKLLSHEVLQTLFSSPHIVIHGFHLHLLIPHLLSADSRRIVLIRRY